MAFNTNFLFSLLHLNSVYITNTFKLAPIIIISTFILATTHNKKHVKYYTQQLITYNQNKYIRQSYLQITNTSKFLHTHSYYALFAIAPTRIYKQVLYYYTVFLILLTLSPTCDILFKIR